MGFWASLAAAGKAARGRIRNAFAGETNGPRWSASIDAHRYFGDKANWRGVKSSNVAAIGYFTSVKKGVKSCLGVAFLNGTYYLYDCPISVYMNMMAATSKGKAVWGLLRRAGVPYDGPHGY